jgi:uncharacterized membrane protein YphA (DoxX/SURF4 family)
MGVAAGIIELVGRILFGLYFVYTGAGFHVPKSKMAEEYARAMRFPVPGIAGWPTGLWMIAGACPSPWGSGPTSGP